MKFTRTFVNRRTFFTKLFMLIAGVCIGLTVSNWTHSADVYQVRKPCVMVRRSEPNRILTHGRSRKLTDELDTKRLLFAGIMTAEKFLDSRADVVYNTWGKTVPGRVVFFAGNESGNPRNTLPVVTLSGVDDSYPPQRKSLMMLKYMHDNFIDDYEWFMRCDDDVYIRTDKLEGFLRDLDSSEELFIGQAGQGLASERGQLGLGPNDNFCMGGPGIIMSRSVLKKLAPHLEHCLRNLVSSHEDVEVGRCVRKYVGVTCTWSFEMQWLFYHNQSKTNAFHWDLDTKAVQSAITLHPVKNPAYMYRIHSHFLAQKITAVQLRSTKISNTLQNLKKLIRTPLGSLQATRLKSKKDLNQEVPLNATLHWELFDPKKLFSVSSGPILPVEYSVKRNLNLLLRQTLAEINLDARKVIYRELFLSKVNLGYVRLAPTKGIQYIFDLRMMMYQHIGFSQRKLPLNVQYQAHIQQPFGNLIYTSRTVHAAERPFVNLILPLAGRLQAFKRFLANFERIVLVKNEKVKLLIMYFPKVADDKEHKRILKSYTENYNNFHVTWKVVTGDFSRGLALQLGVAQFSPGSLLFFCDVDLVFDTEFLNRCRRNTLKGRRVYYPMVFSQFNQSISLSTSNRESYGQAKRRSLEYENLQNEAGFWRKYGFGIVCVYGDDVVKVGGFNLNIKGWGLEDVRLFEQFLASGRYDVIRTPDPGLVHIYHVSSCSPDLSSQQLKACKNSAFSQLSDAGSLVNYMTEKGYL